MPPPPGNLAAVSPLRRHRKGLIYGAFLLLVLVLVYVVMRQKAYIDDGFSAEGIPDGTTLPTPCKATDHAEVLRAAYTDASNRTTDVAGRLQSAYSAQAGNLPYTVDSAALLPSGAATPGSLTFRAKCPQGRAH